MKPAVILLALTFFLTGGTFGYSTKQKAGVNAQPQAGRIINMVAFGADNTGKTDCSSLVRKAQEQGDVYFPAGTYLMAPVDVIANRKYYGDGIGKTTIKALHTSVKMLWGVATFDFDGSGHPSRNIENVSISDMTLDYNFVDGWENYYSVIFFKGRPGNYIRNVKIQRVEFMDNAKVTHPDRTGKKGRDAWSINLSSFADSTTDITVDNCISNAESHQFVAGGGSLLRRITISNNVIKKPSANAISFTTVSPRSAEFSDFTITGNTIIDPWASAFLFGHDPTPDSRPISKQTFSNLVIENNQIFIGAYNVYGKNYRTINSFPYVVNLSASEPVLQNVFVRNNQITVSDDYSGGDICLGRLYAFTFNRPPTTITSDFVQPSPGGTVTVNVALNTFVGQPAFQTGGFVSIRSGGTYQVQQVNNLSITLKIVGDAPYAPTGTVIPGKSPVRFLGGLLSNIQFVNNKVTGNKQLKLIASGTVNKLVVSQNNKVSVLMKYDNLLISDASLTNNSDFALTKTKGNIQGVVSNNRLIKTKKNAIALADSISTTTGLKETTRLRLNGNVSVF